MASVADRVKELTVELLDVSEGRVKPDAKFWPDLEADSLTKVELLLALENEFGVELPDEEAEKLTTVGQVTNYITVHAKKPYDPEPHREHSHQWAEEQADRAAAPHTQKTCKEMSVELEKGHKDYLGLDRRYTDLSQLYAHAVLSIAELEKKHKGLLDACAALTQPDNKIHAPLRDGPELEELNDVLSESLQWETVKARLAAVVPDKFTMVSPSSNGRNWLFDADLSAAAEHFLSTTKRRGSQLNVAGAMTADMVEEYKARRELRDAVIRAKTAGLKGLPELQTAAKHLLESTSKRGVELTRMQKTDVGLMDYEAAEFDARVRLGIVARGEMGKGFGLSPAAMAATKDVLHHDTDVIIAAETLLNVTGERGLELEQYIGEAMTDSSGDELSARRTLRGEIAEAKRLALTGQHQNAQRALQGVRAAAEQLLYCTRERDIHLRIKIEGRSMLSPVEIAEWNARHELLLVLNEKRGT